MSRYRPASRAWENCTPLPPDSVPAVDGLEASRRADGVLAGAACKDAPARSRRRPGPWWAWVAGLGALAVAATFWLAADVYSAPDVPPGLACPAGTTAPVQAATGCVEPGPVYDDEEE
ncbi:MAG: hypothetical protein U1E62_15605 [Alsobacter sp.]